MRLGDLALRARRAVRRYGMVGAVGQAAHRVRRIPARRRYARVEHDFDRRYGVETAGVVHLGTLDIPAGDTLFGVSYDAVHPERFRALVGSLPIEYDRYTFVDLGSGKGRALVLAAELPFRRIIGVEFSRELHEVALANVERVRHRGGTGGADRIESLWLDAAQFEFPLEPLVVHLYNPFFGPVLGSVLGNVVASVQAAPRDVLLCFTGDVPAEVRHGDAFAPVAPDVSAAASPVYRVLAATTV